MAEVNNYVRYNKDMKVNFIKIENAVYGDIDSMLAVKDVKGSSTVLYNNFKSEIDAYYFSSSATFMGAFCSVYRKSYSQQYFNYVYTLYDSTNFKDFNIHNHDYYEYMAVVSTQKSDGSYTYRLYENRDDSDNKVYLETDWADWSLSNIEETTTDGIYEKTGNTWLLGLNLEGESLTQNLSVTSWDTLGQFPKLSIGERNYQSGTLTCLLGRMVDVTTLDPDNNNAEVSTQYMYTEKTNDTSDYTSVSDYVQKKKFTTTTYSREIEKYNAWKEFCEDGSLKLLKDIKGNAWIVQITSSPESSFNTQANKMPTTVTFNWSEVMSLDDISIIG